jgi:p-aminobenzoyl-glutamate transporter AbgT
MIKPHFVPYLGLLQSLPIPFKAWCSTGMNFISGLLKSKGFEVILIIVDRLTKFTYFLPLTTTIPSALSVPVIEYIQPYHQISVSGKHNHKFSPCFYGLFEIKQRIGKVMYRLCLPTGSAIHPVLHASQWKKHISNGTNISPMLPIAMPKGQLKIYAAKILDQRVVKHNNMAIP